MQTGLENKPWWVGALVGLGLGAVLVGAGYYVVNKKQLEAIRVRARRLAELQVQSAVQLASEGLP